MNLRESIVRSLRGEVRDKYLKELDHIQALADLVPDVFEALDEAITIAEYYMSGNELDRNDLTIIEDLNKTLAKARKLMEKP